MESTDTIRIEASSGPAHRDAISKVVERSGLAWDAPAPFAAGKSLAEALLEPTRIYAKALKPVFDAKLAKGAAHITGGGFVDNIPRILPPGVCAVVDRSAWAVPPLFRLIEEVGQVDHDEMYRVFNMGIGMVLAVAPGDAPAVLAAEPAAVVIGEVVASATERVRLR